MVISDYIYAIKNFSFSNCIDDCAVSIVNKLNPSKNIFSKSWEAYKLKHDIKAFVANTSLALAIISVALGIFRFTNPISAIVFTALFTYLHLDANANLKRTLGGITATVVPSLFKCGPYNLFWKSAEQIKSQLPFQN